MAQGHPTDSQGRALPDGVWPPNRKAPPGLELVQRFCNTANLESGADRLADTSGLDDWLMAVGRSPIRVATAGLARIIEVREALRALAAANGEAGGSGPSAATQLVDLLDSIPLHLVSTAGGSGVVDVGVAPCSPIDQFLGDVALSVARAAMDGTWPRLKACGNLRCRWVVYDHSKNRSARWCSMQACGGRNKAAAFRRRRQQPVERPGRSG